MFKDYEEQKVRYVFDNLSEHSLRELTAVNSVSLEDLPEKLFQEYCYMANLNLLKIYDFYENYQTGFVCFYGITSFYKGVGQMFFISSNADNKYDYTCLAKELKNTPCGVMHKLELHRLEIRHLLGNEQAEKFVAFVSKDKSATATHYCLLHQYGKNKEDYGLRTIIYNP